MRRFLVPVVAASLLLSACFGSFKATQGVWRFNDDVSDNKFVDEIVFLAMNIVPIYGIAALGDVILFNTIEFWTGDNPLARSGAPEADEASVEVQRDEDGSLTLRRGDEVIRIVRDEAGLQAIDAAGEVISTAHRVDGALVVVDRSGVRTVSAEALARVAAGGPQVARELALGFAAEGALCAVR